MANTNPEHVSSSIRKVWARTTFRDHLVKGFWSRFVGGEGSGAPVIQKTELRPQGAGDEMYVQVTNPLSGAGVQGDNSTLEGNEESLSSSRMTLKPIWYRHAVKLNTRTEKKSFLDWRGEAKMRLSEWGMNLMDEVRWANFAATTLEGLPSETYSSPNVYVVGGGSGVDDVGSSDTLTTVAIQQIKLKLRTQRAKPVMVDGFPFYIFVTHPYTTYDLKRETEYREWVREAQVRGDENPFFRGSLAVLDGVIIYEHENCPIVTNAGSQAVSKGMAFGAEAFVEAVDSNAGWNEDTFDYDKDWGIAYDFAFQPRRALELSSVQVYAEAGNPIS